MKEVVYPAVFHRNDDATITITFPDLPGCVSEGKSLGNAIYMAQGALSQWIGFLSETRQEIPAPSDIQNIKNTPDAVLTLIRAEIKDTRAVKRTLSLPKWMDEKAAADGLSLSKVLQDALKARFSQ